MSEISNEGGKSIVNDRGSSELLRELLEGLKFTQANPRHLVYYTPPGTPGGGEGIEPASRMLDRHIVIEANRLRDLGALIAERMDQDVSSLSYDVATGQVVGALSDAARVAQLAIQQRIDAMGGEDLGWGR